ncbi:MAG: hypothetical protein RR843_11620, partial [Clostridia bacterium]
ALAAEFPPSPPCKIRGVALLRLRLLQDEACENSAHHQARSLISGSLPGSEGVEIHSRAKNREGMKAYGKTEL